jgi:alpha-D-ribose 1-methylphosphonate 5-triphosphate synthase subunit PhnG
MTIEPKHSRQHCLHVLSISNVYTLVLIWDELDLKQKYTWLRKAETGAVMVRGRTGGSGAPFNMGEMTVTRATVRLEDGTVGFGNTAGRDLRKAETIALLDAAFQRDPHMAQRHIPLLAAAIAAKRESQGRKAAATKVEFFTLVRGENPK